MKLNRRTLAALAGLSLALGANAQTPTVTTLDWGFETVFNPSSPTEIENPTAATATASIFGNYNTYFFGTGPEGLYGPVSGLWDIQNGLLELEIDRMGDWKNNYLVDYTVVLRQFVDTTATFFPGYVTFSVPNVEVVGRTVFVEQTGNMVGSWVEDTYHWTQVSLTEPFTMTIAPAEEGNGHILLDGVQLTAVGLDVPEPATLQMVAVGLMGLGLRAWNRRRSA